MTPGADLGRVCDIVRYTYVVRNMKQAGAVCAEFHKSKKLKVVEVVDSFVASDASTDGFWLVRDQNVPSPASSCHHLPAPATSCHLLPPPATSCHLPLLGNPRHSYPYLCFYRRSCRLYFHIKGQDNYICLAEIVLKRLADIRWGPKQATESTTPLQPLHMHLRSSLEVCGVTLLYLR
jgi:hypothetical protein